MRNPRGGDDPLSSSLYHDGRTDIKSEDWYFRGFPAFWNVVVFYLYLCEASQAINLTVVIVLVALTFVPALWVHPLRAAELRRVNVGVVCIWAALDLVILVLLPSRSRWLTGAGLAGIGYFVSLGIARTIGGPRPKQESTG